MLAAEEVAAAAVVAEVVLAAAEVVLAAAEVAAATGALVGEEMVALVAAAALGVGRAPKKEVASTAPKRALAAWRSHCGVASTATVGPGVSPPSAAANAPSRAASTP